MIDCPFNIQLWSTNECYGKGITCNRQQFSGKGALFLQLQDPRGFIYVISCWVMMAESLVAVGSGTESPLHYSVEKRANSVNWTTE